MFVGSRDWWRPIRLGPWLHHGMNYSLLHLLCSGAMKISYQDAVASLFRSLRFLPSGYDVPLHIEQAQDMRASHYQIFYNLYKPSTPFKKTAPPSPDFQVVVVKYECPVYRTNTGR